MEGSPKQVPTRTFFLWSTQKKGGRMHESHESHDEPWRRVHTFEAAREACRVCSEILFVKGPRSRFDAMSVTQVVRDANGAGPYFQDHLSDASSICAHYLRWLYPHSEIARSLWNDKATPIELWTNDRKLHFFEASPATAARRLAHQQISGRHRLSRHIAKRCRSMKAQSTPRSRGPD